MKSFFDENKVKVVVADLSTNDQNIWKELKEMGFGGLPVNLVYPSIPGAKPQVLPIRLGTDDIEEAVRKASEL